MNPGTRQALRAIRTALDNAPTTCRFHGDQFGRLGWAYGEPRCDSCKQPWRVVTALRALDRIEAGQDQPLPHVVLA